MEEYEAVGHRRVMEKCRHLNAEGEVSALITKTMLTTLCEVLWSSVPRLLNLNFVLIHIPDACPAFRAVYCLTELS
jgi:hypothetical protein